MNGLVSFRLCKLSTPDLLENVDKLTDEMYQKGELPTRHIPARPNSDYDLLIGELIQRMMEHEKYFNYIEEQLTEIVDYHNITMASELRWKIGRYLAKPYGTPKPAKSDSA